MSTFLTEDYYLDLAMLMLF